MPTTLDREEYPALIIDAGMSFISFFKQVIQSDQCFRVTTSREVTGNEILWDQKTKNYFLHSRKIIQYYLITIKINVRGR